MWAGQTLCKGQIANTGGTGQMAAVPTTQCCCAALQQSWTANCLTRRAWVPIKLHTKQLAGQTGAAGRVC